MLDFPNPLFIVALPVTPSFTSGGLTSWVTSAVRGSSQAMTACRRESFHSFFNTLLALNQEGWFDDCFTQCKVVHPCRLDSLRLWRYRGEDQPALKPHAECASGDATSLGRRLPLMKILIQRGSRCRRLLELDFMHGDDPYDRFDNIPRAQCRRRQFEDLEIFAADLRRSKLRVPGGAGRLSRMYERIAEPDGGEEAPEQRLEDALSTAAGLDGVAAGICNCAYRLR